jgi:hypothetical protein
MDGAIIPRSMIEAKARSEYARRVPRDGHGFNWHCTDAIDTWQAEWDRCAAAEAAALMVKPMLERAGENPP